MTVSMLALLSMGLSLTLAAESPAPAATSNQTAATTGPEVTLIGSVLNQRMLEPPMWDHKRNKYDLVLYAFDGTPAIRAEVDAIMKDFWKGDTLDCEQALTLQGEFTKRVKYYLVSSPLVDAHHNDCDYPSHAMAVTGTIFEKDGKRWMNVTKMEEGPKIKINYPAKMLAPDKPRQMPGKDPLVLKLTDKTAIKCILLPSGTFTRGTPFYEHPRWQDEFPHRVTLTKPFYLAEAPVTQAQFEEVMGVNPSKRVPAEPYKNVKDPGFLERMRHVKPDEGSDFAVENATWAEIQTFCRKLSERNGRTVRILTQAEWEWAARVGTSGPVFTEKYLDQRSYVADKGLDGGACEPIRKHKPNAWGIYDLVKSGWEWVSDYKADNVRDDQIDPVGPARGVTHGGTQLRRIEGGSYRGDTHLCLHGAVDENGNGEEGIVIFRVAVEATPAEIATMDAAAKK